MDISSIYNGMVVKNYKHMCQLLSEPIKGGAAKIAQLKQWNRYFDYSKEGNKIIIKEVYATPKPELEKGNNKIGYIDHIEKLMLDLLVQDRNNGQVFLSKHKLLQELNMINVNYAYGKQNMPELSKFMNINEMDIQEFYESTDGTLKRSLENALNKLKNKFLVFWSYAKTVAIVNVDVATNELDNNKVVQYFKGLDRKGNHIYDYKALYRIRREYREATNKEYKLIVKTERDVMKSLNCKDKQDVIRCGKWDEFNKLVKEILLNKANILFYYDSYKIICNEEHILEEWEELEQFLLGDKERIKTQITLNNAVADRAISNGKKRYQKANKTHDPDNDTIQRRSNDTYLTSSKQLTKTLIYHKQKDIRRDLSK